MRTHFAGSIKMEEMQPSGRFLNGTCGRCLNGFVNNSQERRSPYRPNSRPCLLARRRFFCHSLHLFILTRWLRFPAESPRPSTLGGHLRLGCGTETDAARERLQERGACGTRRNVVDNYIVNSQQEMSLYPGDKNLFFIFSLFVCEFATTLEWEKRYFATSQIVRPAIFAGA
jgi:hypothetical protein